jgi:hypothetical protein
MIPPVGVFLFASIGAGTSPRDPFWRNELIREIAMKSATRFAHRAQAASRRRFGGANPTEGSRAKLTMAKQTHRRNVGRNPCRGFGRTISGENANRINNPVSPGHRLRRAGEAVKPPSPPQLSCRCDAIATRHAGGGSDPSGSHTHSRSRTWRGRRARNSTTPAARPPTWAM